MEKMKKFASQKMEARSKATLELVETLTHKGLGVAGVTFLGPKYLWSMGPAYGPKYLWSMGPAGCTRPCDDNGDVNGDGDWGLLPDGPVKFYLKEHDIFTFEMVDHKAKHKKENTWYFQEAVAYLGTFDKLT